MVYNSESGAELLNIKTKYASNSFSAIFCYLVAKSCLTRCDPMDCSMSGLPVPHYLPEFAQVHVH